MNRLLLRCLALALCSPVLIPCEIRADAPVGKPQEILAVMERAADWQLAHPNHRAPMHWGNAVFFRGLASLGQVSPNPAYLEAALKMGSACQWRPGKRIYHADDQVICQAYLALYDLKKDPAMLAPTRQRLEAILAAPKETPLAGLIPYSEPWKERWSWCDALFMAPPVWAHLAAITGETRYLDFVDREWEATRRHLYDPAEHLFYRDCDFFDRRSPNGSKVFWARGNGWVLAGIPLMLEYWPKDRPSRSDYEAIFREMAETVLKAQQPDGLWRSNLLDPAEYPEAETSSSALFVFGLAWGVNHGLLDPAIYWPAVLRGWAGLTGKVRADGLLQNVQPMGSGPAGPDPTGSESYGTGALLLAGCELIKATQSR